MSYLINENSLAELTHGNAAERDTAGLNSGSNPFTSPHSPTTIIAIPHQRGTPVKLFQWVETLFTKENGLFCGGLQEGPKWLSDKVQLSWAILLSFSKCSKHTDSVEHLGAKKPLNHEEIQIAEWVGSFQQRIFFLPNLGVNLIISEISVHTEVVNCGVRKGQCLPIGIMVVLVLKDCGCVAMFNFLIFWRIMLNHPLTNEILYAKLYIKGLPRHRKLLLNERIKPIIACSCATDGHPNTSKAWFLLHKGFSF